MNGRGCLLGSVLVPDLAHPRAEDVDVRFMQFRLRTMRRFSGHPAALFVDEHERLAEALARRLGYVDAVSEWARHHDHHEFAIGDVVTPLDVSLGASNLQALKASWDAAISDALGIRLPCSFTREAVCRVDEIAMVLEWRHCLRRSVEDLGCAVSREAVFLSEYPEVLEQVVGAARLEEIAHGHVLLGR